MAQEPLRRRNGYALLNQPRAIGCAERLEVRATLASLRLNPRGIEVLPDLPGRGHHVEHGIIGASLRCSRLQALKEFHCLLRHFLQGWTLIRAAGLDPVGVLAQGLEKLPFKLDFDEYEDTYAETKNQRFYGAKMLVFNNSFKDATMIRELLCLALMRDLDAHASRASTTRMFVNGIYGRTKEVDVELLLHGPDLRRDSD